MIAFHNAYHGSTQGALSVMGGEYWRNAFRPLLPDILHFNYDDDVVIAPKFAVPTTVKLSMTVVSDVV